MERREGKIKKEEGGEEREIKKIIRYISYSLNNGD